MSSKNSEDINKNHSSSKKNISKKTITETRKQSIKSTRKSKVIKSYKSLNARITRKSQRKFDVERVSKILDIIPQFSAFYNKLNNNEIMAIKYYKGNGSYFQSELLSDYKNKTKSSKGKHSGGLKNKKQKEEKREFKFPFYALEEESLRRDIFQYGLDLLPMMKSFDIKELPKYIETSYKARIELLNRLDRIFDRPDCPRMNGKEILFRGMRKTPEIANLKVGDTYLFNNFISTTIDRNVAENFSSGQYVFIFMNMEDIPFIYMPNSKMYGDDKFGTFIKQQYALYDLSEYTLPRNLEFKIEKVEKKPIQGSWGFSSSDGTFSKIQKILKSKGYFPNNNQSTTPTTTATTATAIAIPTTTTDNPTPTAEPMENKKYELIEQKLFEIGTFYYCTLSNWYPRTPLSFEELTRNGKFVLDKNALDSWSKPNTFFN